MKKLLGILACALLVTAFSAHRASAQSESTFSLFGAYWNTSALDDTFGGGAEFSFPFGDTPLGLEARGTYYRQLADGPVGNLFDDDEGFFTRNSLRVTPIDLGLRLNLHPYGAFNPWISAGGTYFFIDSKREGTDVDNETGWYGSVGSRFGQKGGINFFAEALYRSTEATIVRRRNDTTLQDRVNIDLDGFAANAGILWSF